MNANVWRFFRAVFSANRDYPYHDYVLAENESEDDPLQVVYAVGSGNVDVHGDQSKRFVSKRMLLWTTDDFVHFRLNDSRNVRIPIPVASPDGVTAPIIFAIELHANINTVYVDLPTESELHIYCEGILPEEARDAE